MSQSLHPVGFVETAGGCEGPRYTRSQPSRETGGVLLNECQGKYISEFELPYRNIARYISELESSWDKLTPKDKSLVTQNLFKNVPELKGAINDTQLASFTTLSFIRDYVSRDPIVRTKEVLNALYHPSNTIKDVITDEEENSIKKGVDEWSAEQCWYFHFNMKTVFIFIIFILIFYGLGAASCKAAMSS